MKVSQQLRKPGNWADFETLCKKLWSEIWKSPETTKNGRSGQAQQGIDICGMPHYEEKAYYGIQCKGKDDYTNSKLTKKEVDREVDLALGFEPPLRKMYFATTANKDAKIQSYIRRKNVDHIERGLFEIHLFAWEDIVDLIDENRDTYNYYVNSQSFNTSSSCRLTFENNECELTVCVPFVRVVTKYRLENAADKILNQNLAMNKILLDNALLFKRVVDKSFGYFFLRLHNTGDLALEDYKIQLTFNGDFQLIEVYRGMIAHMPSLPNEPLDVYFNSDGNGGKIIPRNRTLVSDDTIGFNDLRIKPNSKPTTIEINWKLISRNFKQEGVLKLNVEIDIKEEYKHSIVKDVSEIKTVEGELENYET